MIPPPPNLPTWKHVEEKVESSQPVPDEPIDELNEEDLGSKSRSAEKDMEWEKVQKSDAIGSLSWSSLVLALVWSVLLSALQQ